MTTPMTRPSDDPYLWLEEVEGEAPLAWARARNAETAEVLASDDMRGLEQRIRDFLDADLRLADLRKAGRWYYHFWKDAHHPRGMWRRTTLDEYRKDTPAWDTVLDLDALAAAEGERWVWQGVDFLQPDCRRCLVILSRGGTDADVVREFDLEAKQFVADGFRMPEAKNNVMWRDVDTLFIGADFGPGSMTASGYPRTVRLWRRGTPISAAEPVFEASADDVVVYAWRDLTPGFERDFIVRIATFFTSEWLLWRDGRFIRLDKPDSAQVSIHRELLFIHLRDDWAVGGTTHPAGSLLAADFEAFVAGERCFAVLFAPDARTSLMSYSPTRHHILLNELHDVRNRIVVLTRDGDRWQRALLSGLPRAEMIVADAVDPVEGDDYFATASDNLTPTQLLHGTIGAGAAVDPEAGAARVRRERTRDHAARSGVARRYPRALLPGGARGPRARRQPSHAAHRLRRLRDVAPAEVQRLHRHGVARARRRLRRGQHPRRRRVRTALARGRARREPPAVPTRTSSRWPRTSCAARSPRRPISASRGAAMAAS